VSGSLRSLALFGAFLLPTALLAWVGWRTMSEAGERAQARYLEQAQALIDAVEARVAAGLAALAEGRASAGPIPARFARDGAWLGQTLERPDAADGAVRDALLFGALRTEIDRLQAAGGLERAIERLRSAATKDDDPAIAAWALETLATLARQLDRSDEAAAARQELVQRFPQARDARGLKRSFAVRRALAQESAEPAGELLALLADVLDDFTALDQTATAQLAARLEAELELELAGHPHAAAAARLSKLRAREAERARLRLWLASLPSGISDWAAQGAPGGWAEFALAQPPLDAGAPPATPGSRRVLVALHPDGDGQVGAALELGRFFDAVVAELVADPALGSLGFSPLLEDAAGRWRAILPADTGELAGEAVARRALPAPLAAYTVAVHGGDLPGFLERERHQRLWTAAIVAAALVAALLAALTTLRAVAREVAAAAGREAFIAAVTHELKAPLAAIHLFAEVLQHGDVEPAKVREFGARTVQESDRLVRLVDAVLSLAKLEHGADSAPSEPVDLGGLARRVLLAFELVARERGFGVELQAAQEPLLVHGDADALEGALLNLLDNALKYSDEPHTIEVALGRAADGRAEIAVLDRGRGVAAADAERVFAPFARLGDELTRDRPGVGLGLALVSRIAAAHGGRASVAPRAGGGSRFVIALPALEAE